MTNEIFKNMGKDIFKIVESNIPEMKLIKYLDKKTLSISEISISTPSNDALTAFYLKPKKKGKYPCVLYSHWLANKHDANKTEFLSEAEQLCNKGYVCLLIDTVFANWPKARMKWKGDDYKHDRQIVIQQIVELRYFLFWIRTQPEIDVNRIALVGHDFGAMFNAVLSGIEKNIKACVFMAAISDFSDWFTLRKKMTDADLLAYFKNMSDLAPIKYLEMANNTSFLFQFGKKDKSFVPKENADLLVEKTNGNKEVKYYDEGHAIHLNATATTDRINWLIKQLG